jgi:hypothetical protein
MIRSTSLPVHMPSHMPRTRKTPSRDTIEVDGLLAQSLQAKCEKENQKQKS